MPNISLQAPAKINLGLRVLNKRADGFHELRTVFQTISVADEVSVELRPAEKTRVRLTCDRPELANDENLAAQAARALLERLGVSAEIDIALHKSIRMGAGLGGGSSDAAAVLLALRSLLHEPPRREILFETAAALGSDVPYFLLGGTAIGLGRGEEVYPLPDLDPEPIVLVSPDLEVSTAWAYQALAETRETQLTQTDQLRTMNGFCSGVRVSEVCGVDGLAGVLTNDFEQVVFERFPQLQGIRNRLLSAGARYALLSGSGASLFGIFEGEAVAEAAARSLELEGLKAQKARFLQRSEYRNLRG